MNRNYLLLLIFDDASCPTSAAMTSLLQQLLSAAALTGNPTALRLLSSPPPSTPINGDRIVVLGGGNRNVKSKSILDPAPAMAASPSVDTVNGWFGLLPAFGGGAGPVQNITAFGIQFVDQNEAQYVATVLWPFVSVMPGYHGELLTSNLPQ